MSELARLGPVEARGSAREPHFENTTMREPENEQVTGVLPSPRRPRSKKLAREVEARGSVREQNSVRASMRSERIDGEDAITIRPPPPEVELDLRATLPPKERARLPDRVTPMRPPSLEALFQAQPTGALLKLLEPALGQPREDVKMPRRRR